VEDTARAESTTPDRAATEHVDRKRIRPQDTFHFSDAAQPNESAGQPAPPEPAHPADAWGRQLAEELEPGQSACLVLDGKLFVQLDAAALSRQKAEAARVRLGDGEWQPLDRICSVPESTPGVSFTAATLAPRLAAILRPHPARWVTALSKSQAWALRISGGRIVGMVGDRSGPVPTEDMAAAVDALLRVDHGELLDGPSMASPREEDGLDLAVTLTQSARRVYSLEEFHGIYDSLSHRFERGSVPSEDCLHLFTRPELRSLNGIGLPATFQKLVSDLGPDEALTRARAIYVGLCSGLLALEGLTGR
ncbi:MAG: hypothetical protein QGG40_02810, partial [Myxococcota bacterium]|nr:hypothetical protein [Myxococcota bacterium]